MRGSLFIGIVIAIMLHAGIILFGGSLFASHKKDSGTLQKVELLSEEGLEEKQKEKPKDKQEKTEEMEAENEKPPDAAEIIHNIDLNPSNSAPALEAASLSEIEAALSGQLGKGGDFSSALSFSSGGRIGGTGKVNVLEQNFDNAFNLSEIDQKPQAVFQAAPVYPASMHNVQGVVSLFFVVDKTGKVINPRVEKSSNKEFEKPAMDAIKQWKFEPAVKAGQRVSCKMHVPIRFLPR